MKFRPERAVCMAIEFASFEEYYKGCVPMEYIEVFNLADKIMDEGADGYLETMRNYIVDGIDRTPYERENMLDEYTRFVRIMDGSASETELKQIRYKFEDYYRNWDDYYIHDWDGLSWKPREVIIDLSVSDRWYEIGAYFGRNFRGLDDSLKTTDKSQMQDFVHNRVSRGDYILITAHYGIDDVKEYRITPDYYWEDFDGEFPYPHI